ncbi:methyltransferase domain-containing protein [Paenibacillus sp. FSL W8-1187]|uniref:methyltransferase domain-containing protein n=1 Tax=Paenibacillus sp. FSL W8-1187 TaxID=2975339 RepID=UPI0030D9CCB7
MSRKTSIVVLTYNELSFTEQCLESIRAHTDPDHYELIVVDNASTDGTREWLTAQSGIKLLLNDDNKGFPAGCNQGVALAEPGNDILLLNNDTIVTENWLLGLQAALHSSDTVGAVGPITNYAMYNQSIPVSYSSLQEMHAFARTVSETALDQPYERRLKLIGFCYLIKREALNQVGLLDERFTPGNYEDDDYSFRLLENGYELLLCHNVFIHHYGGTSFGKQPEQFSHYLTRNNKLFEEKWGFNSIYSSYMRNEIISLMQSSRKSPIRVLEVGCACGGTLLKIKHLYPEAELYGIELNEASARIAATFANVRAENIEHELSFPEEFFDYIVFADVLEHLYDPWKVLQNMIGHLKPRGAMLVSLPNVMHHSVLKDLLNGNWTYADAGLLDRTHVRFFTKTEMIRMFRDVGFNQILVGQNRQLLDEEQAAFIQSLKPLSTAADFEEQAQTYQYFFRLKPLTASAELEHLIGELDSPQPSLTLIEELAAEMERDVALAEQAKRLIRSGASNSVHILNALAITFYDRGSLDFIVPLLHEALILEPDNSSTLFNMGAILYQASEYELALSYLERIESSDEGFLALLHDARARLAEQGEKQEV